MSDEIKLTQDKGRLIIEWDGKTLGTSVHEIKGLLNEFAKKRFNTAQKYSRITEVETIISVNQDIRINRCEDGEEMSERYRVASFRPCIGGVSARLICHDASEEDVELILFERPFREGDGR